MILPIESRSTDNREETVVEIDDNGKPIVWPKSFQTFWAVI